MRLSAVIASLMLLCASSTSRAAILQAVDVASVPAGAFVCIYGTGFPEQGSATIKLDGPGGNCTVPGDSSVTLYELANVIGTPPNRACFAMPAAGTDCGDLSGVILHDGSANSNSLPLARHTGSVYFVDDDGSGSTCSSGSPCPSIRTALNQSGCTIAGCAVVVRAGTYHDSDDSDASTRIASAEGDINGTAAAPMTLQGYPGEYPLILADGSVPAPTCVQTLYVQTNYWQLVGLRTKGRGNSSLGDFQRWAGNKLNEADIDGCYSGPTVGKNGLFITSGATDGIFIVNDANDNGIPTTNADHGLYVEGSRWLFAYNEMARNTWGIQQYKGGGTPLSTNNVFHSNSVHDNTHGSGGGMILGLGGQGTLVYNNLVYDNEGDGIRLQYGSPTDFQIFNNTLYSNDGTCIALYSATNTIVKNNICRSNGSNSIGGSGSSGTVSSNNLFGTDPQFVNPGALNFRLQATSPARDTGTTPPTAFSEDYDSNPSPVDTREIGAFEYQNPVALCCLVTMDNIILENLSID